MTDILSTLIALASVVVVVGSVSAAAHWVVRSQLEEDNWGTQGGDRDEILHEGLRRYEALKQNHESRLQPSKPCETVEITTPQSEAQPKRGINEI
jgi:hypothetical protein